MTSLTVLPTPITDSYKESMLYMTPDNWVHQMRTLERDAMTLALRLYGESYETFSPETMEVMDRWRPRCKALLETVPE